MTDIVERLRALEACETELAHDGDCPPEATANWKYAETCRLAAAEIARLSRDWDTVREAHDNLVCELDLRLTERRQQAAEIERLRAEVATWQGHAKTAIWSDSEECKMLTRINEALLEAPTVDVDVVVPDRDYSAMTPKDCYEAGLLDGVYQAREAIKAAVRAALEDRT